MHAPPAPPTRRQNNETIGAQLYTPATNSWARTAAMTELRCSHSATLLTDGSVLVAGGQRSLNGTVTLDEALASAEVYDPTTKAWAPVVSLSVARTLHSASLFPDGSMLVAAARPTRGPPRRHRA